MTTLVVTESQVTCAAKRTVTPYCNTHGAPAICNNAVLTIDGVLSSPSCYGVQVDAPYSTPI